MNREQVKELFKILVDVYPRFEVSTSKVDTWTSLLKDQDYEIVISNALHHCKTSRFEPVVADVISTSARMPEFNFDMSRGEDD